MRNVINEILLWFIIGLVIDIWFIIRFFFLERFVMGWFFVWLGFTILFLISLFLKIFRV